MKRILFILAMLPMIMFTFSSCSDDDDNKEEALIGTWVEDTDYEYEVLHVQFKSDHSGYFWTTDEGIISDLGKEAFTWFIDGDKLITQYEDGESETGYFSVNGDKLILSGNGDSITYKRQ